ncbi:uncharacterized protein [Triticum aestivum]|uniref:uncharacterized protein isoform X2 n=1 Tax=Triticum aestivum TaxID=4565 RepID=UPI001D00B978|nr:uncharacterized protein LOC123040076 isoform X2 [Triticum aestivum]
MSRDKVPYPLVFMCGYEIPMGNFSMQPFEIGSPAGGASAFVGYNGRERRAGEGDPQRRPGRLRHGRREERPRRARFSQRRPEAAIMPSASEALVAGAASDAAAPSRPIALTQSAAVARTERADVLLAGRRPLVPFKIDSVDPLRGCEHCPDSMPTCSDEAILVSARTLGKAINN